MEEAINHPQTKERQMVLHKDEYQGIASPIKFSRSKSVGVKNIPPQIGEHTNEILLELNSVSYTHLTLPTILRV